jgi:hypothetical protein
MVVADLPAEARVIPSLKQAWTNIWPSFWWLLLFGLIAGLANNGGSNNDYETFDLTAVIFDGVAILIGVFVGIPLTYGLIRSHLQASRGEKPVWADLALAFNKDRYWRSIGLSLLVAVIIIGGLILLIIPGIYLAVRLSFASYHFVDSDLPIKECLKASWADTDGRWWNVLGLALMAIPLFIAGVLALVVGVSVAIVLTSQMGVVYWRAIDQRA